MFEEQPQQQLTTLRIVMAIVFFAIAAPLGVWLLKTVNSTINDTEKPAILQQICPASAALFDVNTPSLKIEIPRPVMNGLSYFIFYLFLIIPTAITVALIKGGVSLLNPDMSKQLRNFVDSIRKAVPPKL